MSPSKQSNREKIVSKLFSSILKGLDVEDLDSKENVSARDILGAVANWGGKSKDEIVQVLCREVGVATAAVLKEPLSQVLENRKLQITMELVPKDQSSPDGPKAKGRSKTQKKTKAKKKT